MTRIHHRRTRSVSSGSVESAVRSECHSSNRLARVLLKPVFDQHLLRADHYVAAGLQTRQARTRDTAVSIHVRAGVRGCARRPPAWRRAAYRRIVGVKDVNVGIRWKVGIKNHADQTAISKVVHLCPQIGEDSG